MSSIAFFAHKGGVGKSTLIFDLSYYLISQGKNVVIIDADTQLNTSFKILQRNGINPNSEIINSFLEQNYNHLTISLNQGNNNNQNQTYGTIYSYICGSNYDFRETDLITVNGTNNRMKIILGSPILYNLELQLTNAIFSPQNNPAAANVPLLFKSLLTKIKKYYENKGNVTIFIDMSPSSSILNQNILLSCDYFVIPCNSDDNSMISLDLLFRYINNWRIEHHYLNHNIKFLFAILNRYKTTNIQNNTVSNACDHFKMKINDSIRSFLNKEVNNHIKYNEKYNYDNILIDRKIMMVQNMMRFAEICSSGNISIFELSNQVCVNHGTSLDPIKVKSIRDEIILIYNILINNNLS